MKKEKLIIVLPGFEYKKNGSLSIDKVIITAVIGDEKLSIFSLDCTNKTLKESKSLELERVEDGTDNFLYGDIYTDNVFNKYNEGKYYLYNKQVVEYSLGRVKEDCFNLIKKDEDTFVLSAFSKNVGYTNQDDEQHDGLGFIKLNNINTDIYFHVEFYTRVTYTELDENLSEVTESADVDNYVFLYKKIYYYNPILSGIIPDYVIGHDKNSIVRLLYENKEGLYDVYLGNNVIVYNKNEYNKKLLMKYNKDRLNYYDHEDGIEINPNKHIMYTGAFILDTDNWTDYLNGPLGGAVQFPLYLAAGNLISSANMNRINPIRMHQEELNRGSFDGEPDFPDGYLRVNTYFEKLKDYLRDKCNDLGIYTNNLHKYGIYLCDASHSGYNYGLCKKGDHYKFEPFKEGPSSIQVPSESKFDDQGLGAGALCVSGSDGDYSGLTSRTPMVYESGYYKSYGKEYTLDTYLHDLFMGMYRYTKNDTAPLKEANSSEVIAYSPSVTEASNFTTEYTYFNNDLTYLYNHFPTIKLCNISSEDPLAVRYAGNGTVKPIELYLYPEGFISALNDTKLQVAQPSTLRWDWKYNNKNLGNSEVVFPNYWLAVEYNGSNLNLPFESDYKIIPLVYIEDSGSYCGFSGNLLLQSNIFIRNCLDTSTLLKEYSYEGFCKYLYIKNNNNIIKDIKMTIKNSGFYIFNYNGIYKRSYYVDNKQDKYCHIQLDITKKSSELEGYQKVLTKKLYLYDDNYTMKDNKLLMYISEGEYNITLTVYDLFSMGGTRLCELLLSAVGVYELNIADLKQPHNEFLKKELDEKLEEIEATEPIIKVIEDEYNAIYSNIILPAAFVYQENKIKCNTKSGTMVYPPDLGYYQVYHTYTINNDRLKIEEKLPDFYFLLNKGSNTLTADLILFMQLKKIRYTV